jgi:hypothetical protein
MGGDTGAFILLATAMVSIAASRREKAAAASADRGFLKRELSRLTAPDWDVPDSPRPSPRESAREGALTQEESRLLPEAPSESVPPRRIGNRGQDGYTEEEDIHVPQAEGHGPPL